MIPPPGGEPLLAPSDIESLERSVVAAVAPARVVEITGWLVPLDDGAIGRARSAVPLVHAADPAAVAPIVALFAEAGLPPAFRLADVPALATVREALLRHGLAPHTPTVMKVGTAAGLAALSDRPAELQPAPDAAWTACFVGEGFDPEEGRARARNLARSPDALYAAVREAGRVVAVGVATFGCGWAGIHGMRTAPGARRQGHAGRILAAFGRAAAARGIDRAALQVTEDNPARSLYRAAGFRPAWRYDYWSRG
jgi:GNAT superfamily N-acetyltransferase